MKGRAVILDTWRGREAAAHLVDGRLDDLIVAAPAEVPPPGAIYRGRVDRPMKGQGGVTVTLPDGRGFLKQAKGIGAGQTVLVQVTGYAERGKAVPLTSRLTLKSRYAIATPGAPGVNVSRAIRDPDAQARLNAISVPAGETGVILRSRAETAETDEIVADAASVIALSEAVLGDAAGAPALLVDGDGPHALAWRDWPDPDTFDDASGAFDRHEVTDRIEALLALEQPLPGGGSVVVEPTRALVAVDVNTGSDLSLAAGLKANLAVAQELPRLLRCRGLGGQVTVDLAPAPRKDRRTIEQAFTRAFRSDPVDTHLAGWTPLGHFELQRKRERYPLAG